MTPTLAQTLTLCFGVSPPYRKHDPVLICTVDGCMAETLTVSDKGTLLGPGKVPCLNRDPLPGVRVRLEDGTETVELLDRLRRLEDGRLVICN